MQIKTGYPSRLHGNDLRCAVIMNIDGAPV